MGGVRGGDVGGVYAAAGSDHLQKRSNLLSRTTGLPVDGDLGGSVDLWVSAELGLLSVVLVLVSSLLGSSVVPEPAGPSLQDVSLDRNLSPCPSSLDVTVFFSWGSFSLEVDLVLDGLSRRPFSVDVDLDLLSSEGPSLDLDVEPPPLLDLSLEASSAS